MRRRDDAWRFLTPELEREAPALVATLSAAAGAPQAAGDVERRFDRLVVAGDDASWFAELRALRAVLEAAVAGGADRRVAHRFALILLEQYLLAPSVHVLDSLDDAERDRLRALACQLAP
jgi:hypothetical protein